MRERGEGGREGGREGGGREGYGEEDGNMEGEGDKGEKKGRGIKLPYHHARQTLLAEPLHQQVEVLRSDRPTHRNTKNKLEGSWSLSTRFTSMSILHPCMAVTPYRTVLSPTVITPSLESFAVIGLFR